MCACDASFVRASACLGARASVRVPLSVFSLSLPLSLSTSCTVNNKRCEVPNRPCKARVERRLSPDRHNVREGSLELVGNASAHLGH